MVSRGGRGPRCAEWEPLRKGMLAQTSFYSKSMNGNKVGKKSKSKSPPPARPGNLQYVPRSNTTTVGFIAHGTKMPHYSTCNKLQ